MTNHLPLTPLPLKPNHLPLTKHNLRDVSILRYFPRIVKVPDTEADQSKNKSQQSQDLNNESQGESQGNTRDLELIDRSQYSSRDLQAIKCQEKDPSQGANREKHQQSLPSQGSVSPKKPKILQVCQEREQSQEHEQEHDVSRSITNESQCPGPDLQVTCPKPNRENHQQSLPIQGSVSPKNPKMSNFLQVY